MNVPDAAPAGVGLMRNERGGRDKFEGSAHDPGPAAAAERAAALLEDHRHPSKADSRIRVGTAGWTDATLTKNGVFYPEGVTSAEERLRYYSSIFTLVEVDSSYYSLPSPRNSALWVERTPPGFLFDMKAHALMTGQPTEVNRLPHAIQDALTTDLAEKDRIYGKDLPAKLYDKVWKSYMEGIEPLQEAGKLGSILLQYPRWFHPSQANRDSIVRSSFEAPPGLVMAAPRKHLSSCMRTGFHLSWWTNPRARGAVSRPSPPSLHRSSQ